MLGQIRRQLLCVRDTALTEPKASPDLRAVVLGRRTRPVVGLQLRGGRRCARYDNGEGRRRWRALDATPSPARAGPVTSPAALWLRTPRRTRRPRTTRPARRGPASPTGTGPVPPPPAPPARSAQAPSATASAASTVGFLPTADIDPLRIGPGYYLQPQGSIAAKPYVLLRQALQRASKMAVARYAWHGRERLGLLRVRGDVIALHTLLWPDEIRDPAQITPGPVHLEPGEIDEAMTLVEIMSRDSVEGPEFTDQYTQALREVVEAKQEHHRPPQAPQLAARPGQLVDLMATLQQSVNKARAARGENSADIPDLPTAATKTERASIPGRVRAAHSAHSAHPFSLSSSQ
ncbi:Ku protein [Streptomyces sp. NPDC058424]|uniref:Ku protein n=1 Tax=Streptomyces sp. NPDC058424 TaxID=3346491 RepID=UPI003653525C